MCLEKSVYEKKMSRKKSVSDAPNNKVSDEQKKIVSEK
jgi:hypothetical protein